MNKSGESRRLDSAPVYLTYCLVHFNNIELMSSDKFIPDIQERFRTLGYSANHMLEIDVVEQVQTVEAGEPPEFQLKKHKVWYFYNQEKTKFFILDKGSFWFCTTMFDRKTLFINEFLEKFSIVASELRLDNVNNVGIRYLDAIFPQEEKNESLEDYLNPNFLGRVQSEGHQYSNFDSKCEFTDPVYSGLKGLSTLKIHQANSTLRFPNDVPPLFDFNVKHRFEKCFDTAQLHAMMDTYEYFEGHQAVNYTDVDQKMLFDQFMKLTDRAYNSFKEATTKYAMGVWGAKND